MYLIYDKKKGNPRPPKEMTHHAKPKYNGNYGSPFPRNEYELLDMNTKTSEYNDEVFWPMTQGPKPNRNEIWNLEDNNPTLV